MLRAGLVLVVMLAPTVAAARDHRVLTLRQAATGDEIRLRPFRRYGRLAPRVGRRLRRFFADPTHPDARRAVSPRLVRALTKLQERAGGRLLVIKSGTWVRTGAQPTSYHEAGRAADLRVPGVSLDEIAASCRRLESFATRMLRVSSCTRGRCAVSRCSCHRAMTVIRRPKSAGSSRSAWMVCSAIFRMWRYGHAAAGKPFSVLGA